MSELKTVKEHLESLPDGYRERALFNLGKFPIAINDLEKCSSLSNAINSFSWTQSPEGAGFWCEVSRGNYPLLPTQLVDSGSSETIETWPDRFDRKAHEFERRYNAPALDPKGEAGATKCPLNLIPPAATSAAARAHKYGADKYGAYNWRATKVCASTYVSALMRHFDSWRDGEDTDPDSGLSHLAHVAANVNILLDAIACDVLHDDRHKRPTN